MKYMLLWEQASKFKVAIQERDSDTIKTLLDSGFDCDYRFRAEPAICLCVETGNLQLVQLLVSAGCSVNQRSSFFKKSPLHIATEQGYEDIVNLLLWKRASVNILDNEKNTPLHLAAHTDNIRVIQSLVDNGAHINKRNSRGSTPLMIACELGCADIVAYLLSKGANPRIVDSGGRTAIHFGHRKCRILKLLLEHGASLKSSNGLCYLSDILSKEDCAYPETQDLMLLCLEAGADVDETDVMGMTPLHDACVLGNVDMVRLLVRMGCSLNPRNKLGLTPMFHAASNGHSFLVRFLHSAGVSMQAQPWVKHNELFWAIKSKDTRDYVLRHSNDVPPLGVACRESLRRYYKHHFMEAIEKETLPSSMKQYLSFNS